MIEAIAPLVVLIAFGAWLKRYGRLADGFWAGAERLSYMVLLPALLIGSLVQTDLTMVAVDRLALAVLPVLLVVAVISALAARAIGCGGPSQTSVVQGAIRFNNFICFGLAAGLYGTLGTAMAAILSAFVVPTVNVIVVLSFALLTGHRTTPLAVARQLATNPLVLACVIGAALSLSRLPIPEAAMTSLKLLAQASIGVGLLCVGAGLDVRAVRRDLWPVALATGLKLLVVPALVAILLRWLGVGGVEAAVALILAATPTAPSSYVLARQLGGDAPMVAAMITLQTLVALVTLQIWV
ncbi:MAG: AEC family transporter [Alphaproteobacteria bacterium]|nr:AEC family transporter [Alphaproteobacteria bacterium]